jgi:maltokinase
MSDQASEFENNTTGYQDHDDQSGGASDDLEALLTRWLPSQRWFASKGETLAGVSIEARTPIASLEHRSIEQVLFTVPSPSGHQRYQLWVGWTQAHPEQYAHVVIGETGGWFAYDALHDADVSAFVLSHIAGGIAVGEIDFTPEPGAVIDTSGGGLVIGAEQSNTSIVFGHSSILKVFRRLEPGLNPDAEVHRALQAAGSAHIAAALGVIEGPVAGERTTLALLTGFFANSAEGWAMATASVRDLMAEGDLRADEVGGDFASESLRLGKAVADVHADLATAFGTVRLDADSVAQLISTMIASAEAVAAQVPSIANHLPEIRAAFHRADASADHLAVQRIHGDLQLGQTLRTLTGWAIIDFEGEPSKSLGHRKAMHSPLRDIAGMLRSFDYAANHSGGPSDSQHAYRAQEWASRNRKAFCDGYAAVAGHDPRDMGSLLAAFELDKAVYEVAYEHGHRPSWEPIPLQAVVRLINTGGK